MIPSTEQGLRRLNGTHSNVWCEFFGNRRGGVFPPVRYGFAPLDEGLETKPLQDLHILIHTKRFSKLKNIFFRTYLPNFKISY